jgi:zinc protease
MGVTYSPQVGVAPSWTFPGYGVMSAQIETPTDKIALFAPAVAKITAELRDHPITADQLALALNPEVEQITKQRQTNEYWLGYLTGAGFDPRRLDAARTALPQVSSVTVADIQRLAREVFVDSKAYAIEVRPQAK